MQTATARKSPKPSSIAGMVVLLSANEKVGKAAATYAPIEGTCDPSCPFYSADGEPSAGCYAREGKVSMVERRIASGLAGLSADTIAAIEAAAIRDAAELVPAGRPLRVHVSGDCRTEKAARMISEACEVWPGDVWTYSHVWRTIPRSAWGRVSVLASVESVNDARRAMDRGYAAAIVVDEHPADGKAYRVADMKIVPCPAQTRDDVTCESCGLCLDADKLLALRLVVGFAAHGSGAKKAKRHLTVVR